MPSPITSLSDLAENLKPYLIEWLDELGVSVGDAGFAPSPHDLASVHHTGTLLDSQAPDFVHRTAIRTITAVHTFAPLTTSAPFILGANAQSQLVTGLRADELSKSITVGNGLSGGGTLTTNLTIDIDLDTNPGLQLGAGGLSILLDTDPGLSLGAGGLSVGAGTLIDVSGSTVGLTHGSAQYQMLVTGAAASYTPAWTAMSTLAGSGLAFSAGVLSVGAGTLMSVAADSIGLSNGSAQYQVPVTGATPFTPSWTSVANFAGNGLTFGSGAYHVTLAANSGLSVAADSLAMGTPTTLTVSTSNAVSGSSHSHAITSSSNPGAAASLLASDASGHLQLVRLGLGVSPTSSLHIRSTTTPQVRVEYDASNYGLIQTFNSGNMYLSATGDIYLAPTGNDILPNVTYTKNLGSNALQYLGLYAAELHVGTLVAQDVIATIGGQVMVAPTSKLTAAISAGATSITIADDIGLAAGDSLFMKKAGQLEFMSVVSGTFPTYTVSRDVDLSGPNAWEAGDAIVNLGTTGDGWIEIISRQNFTGTAAGPAMIGSVKTGTAYNAYSEHFLIGNLDGYYGYATPVFGAGLGVYGGEYMTIEPTNGLRMYAGGALNVSLTPSGALTLGSASGGEYLEVSSSGVDMYSGGVLMVSMDVTGGIRVGDDDGGTGEYLTIDYTNGVRMFGAGTQMVKIAPDGSVLLGGSSTENILLDPLVGVKIRDGAKEYFTVSPTGAVVVGLPSTANETTIAIDGTNGITLRYGVSNTVIGQWDTIGDLYLGEQAGAHLFYDNSADTLYFKSTVGTNVMKLDGSASGYMEIGLPGPYVRLSGGGIALDYDGSPSIWWESTLSSSRSSAAIGYLQISQGGGSNEWLGVLQVGGRTGQFLADLYLNAFSDPAGSDVDVQVNLRSDTSALSKVSFNFDTVAEMVLYNTGLRVLNGLYVGSTATAPDDDDIHYDGNLKSVKAGGTFDVYGTRIFETPATGTNFNPKVSSTTTVSKNFIDMSSEFSGLLPSNTTGIKAYLFHLTLRDSGSATTDAYVILGRTSTLGEGVASRTVPVNDKWASPQMWVPANADGDVYWQVNASGTNTFDFYLTLVGYIV